MLIDSYKLTERFRVPSKRGVPRTSPDTEIFLFLWYMTNTNSFREFSNLFGISSSTGWNSIKRVTNWVISIRHEYMKWPSTSEVLRSANLFENKTKIPAILGCIDDTHIKIKAPIANKENYFNRKRYYSISVQGVVDARKKFINVFYEDRNYVCRNACENMTELFPNNTFLLEDSAYEYQSIDWLVPPIRDDGMLTNVLRRFNILHANGCVIVEYAFGLLKTRFRRLVHFTEQRNINLLVNLVMCGCILGVGINKTN